MHTLSDQHDRPVVGAANFCLGDAAGDAVSAGSATTTIPGTALGTDFDRLAETAIHELGPSRVARERTVTLLGEGSRWLSRCYGPQQCE